MIFYIFYELDKQEGIEKKMSKKKQNEIKLKPVTYQ